MYFRFKPYGVSVCEVKKDAESNEDKKMTIVLKKGSTWAFSFTVGKNTDLSAKLISGDDNVKIFVDYEKKCESKALKGANQAEGT